MRLLGPATTAVTSSYPYTSINTWCIQLIQQNYWHTFFTNAQYLGPGLEILMDLYSGITQRDTEFPFS